MWCAENFKLFKTQMVRKNVELELQALVLLQYQLGIIKPGQGGGSGGGALSEAITDDEIMSLVIKKSKDEYDAVMSSKQRTAAASSNHSSSSNSNNNNSNNSSNATAIQKSSDLETAKKLIKSDRFMENLQSELDQQDFINKKLVEEELSPKGRLTNASVERPMSASRKSLEIASKMQDMKLNEIRKAGEGSGGGGKGYRGGRYADDDDDIVSTGNDQHSSPSKAVNHLAENILAVSLFCDYQVRGPFSRWNSVQNNQNFAFLALGSNYFW